mmetsp:Transcript_53641/g.96399  ORF Transcript_53641/g.96399 Transcript_53641/m.96399 type:complete len:541 (+) Transcript_53641:76-1698(+)
MPSNKLLPEQDSALPISKQEMRDLWKAGAQKVCEANGWIPEVTEENMLVHRWTEVLDPDSGKCMDRCCVETVVQASPISALLLVKDPTRRKLWDDFLGPSMQTLRVNEHDFVRFRFDGLYGLAAKSFLLWSCVQAFDRGGTERTGGEGAWSWVMLWRPATVDWRGLPVVDEEYDRNTHWAVIAEPDNQAKTRTRLKVFVCIKHVSTILTRNAIPSLLQNYTATYCGKLQEVATSRNWNDTGDDLLGPRVRAEQTGPKPSEDSRSIFFTGGQSADSLAETPAVGVTGAGHSWLPDKGLASEQMSTTVATSSEAVFLTPSKHLAPEDTELPAYQLRYERSRARDPPPLEPLADRLTDALSDWRATNLKREPRMLPPLLAAEVTNTSMQEIAGFRGTDAWLDSLLTSMKGVQVIQPPWVKKQEPATPTEDTGLPNVWDRLEQVGFGYRPPAPHAGGDATGGDATSVDAPPVKDQDAGMFGGFTSAFFGGNGNAPEGPRLSIVSNGSEGSDVGRRKARQSLRRSTAAFRAPMKGTGNRLSVVQE